MESPAPTSAGSDNGAVALVARGTSYGGMRPRGGLEINYTEHE